VVFYWRLSQGRYFRVSTKLGELSLEVHDLGFGNLQRYQSEVGPILDQTIVEDYSIVVPSTFPEGKYPLTISIQGVEGDVVIGEVQVVNEEEMMERWLRIAGK
jgi:hypothetical protein